MADILIDTIATNPYESIVANTSTQITELDKKISDVTSAIANLEKANPSSQSLPQLRERLASLQWQRQALVQQLNAGKELMRWFDSNAHDITTLAWINQLKQEEIIKAQQESDKTYKQMREDTARRWENYLNATQAATASENAIINANAARNWWSAQSTAEVRARNYLNNAAQWAEIASNNQQLLNAIDEWRLNANAWYVQMSQANADNYLRQDVMNKFQASEAEKDRQLNRELNKSKWSSSSNNNEIDWKWSIDKMSAEELKTIADYIASKSKDDDEQETPEWEWDK